jgi:hypothetical protein
MKTVRIIAGVLIAIMSGNLVNVAVNGGFNHGMGLDTFLAGVRDPWQVFINTDLVVGLVLTISWIVFRERGGRAIDTLIWVWMVAWWGNIVVAAYVIRAASQAGNQAGSDWSIFFMGKNAPGFKDAGAAPSSLAKAIGAAGALAAIAYLVMALLAPGLSAIAVIGYAAAFVPVVLLCARMAMRGRI